MTPVTAHGVRMMIDTEIQTLAAEIQAGAALVFLGTVISNFILTRRERKRRAALDEQEQRDKLINSLLYVWIETTDDKTQEERAGIYSPRQIEYFNKRLKAMGHNWAFPFRRVT